MQQTAVVKPEILVAVFVQDFRVPADILPSFLRFYIVVGS